MAHTTIGPEGTAFIHNGDYSGLITIKFSDEEISVPLADLEYIVGQALKQEVINNLENTSGNTFLRTQIKI